MGLPHVHLPHRQVHTDVVDTDHRRASSVSQDLAERSLACALLQFNAIPSARNHQHEWTGNPPNILHRGAC